MIHLIDMERHIADNRCRELEVERMGYLKKVKIVLFFRLMTAIGLFLFQLTTMHVAQASDDSWQSLSAPVDAPSDLFDDEEDDEEDPVYA